MMRDIYLIINSAIAISLLILGAISFVNNRKSFLNRLFFVFTFCVGVWLVSACVSNDVRRSNEVALYGNYLVFSFSYFSSYLLLWFSVLLVGLDRIKKFMKLVNIPLIFVGILSSTPLVVAGVEKQGSVYAVIFGPLAVVYGVVLLLLLGGSMRILHVGVKTSSSRKKIQLRSILRSIYVAVPVLVITQFIAPVVTGSFEVTDIGILIMALPVIGLYLSIIKHGLFDIRGAIIRSTAYVLSLSTLSVVYYLLAYAISVIFIKNETVSGFSLSPLNIALALVIAFAFQPVKSFFDKYTDKFFYKDNYSSDEFFTNLNKTLASTIDLRGLLERAASDIAKTLKSEQAFFFVEINSDHYMNAGTTRYKMLPISDVRQLGAFKDVKNGVIVASLLSQNNPIRKLMISHKLELILPLLKDGKAIGYLCLGEHMSSSYSLKDIKVLNAISNSLIIAIQNALAIQEIREFNSTLKQRIASATEELRANNRMLRQLDKAKDEFVGMASHQLRTPLTSVKGYISMVLDGDAGKVSDSQKKLLNEAFDSSERMVNLINDFLNISRIQTGKFIIDKKQFDLSKLVEEEINNLESSAKTRNLKFKYNKPSEFPMMNADMEKIRQVVMNFLDNAIYYSQDDSSIQVGVSQEKGRFSLEIKDSGIGVPIGERDQLFTKFYRASNARSKRPDGTGVGLYLAKKVIDAHDGKVIFESIEGKGSTFGFVIPAKQLSV